MKFGIANISIIPIRKEPSDKSEMISQVLFGECYKILFENEKWSYIELCYDKYQGWIDKKNIIPINEDLHNDIMYNIKICNTEISNIDSNENSYNKQILSPGSSLPFYNSENKSFAINNDLYFHKGKTSVEIISENKGENIINSALKFINSPYIWGGRSIFGIDCSGLTQIVFKMNNIFIPRDAYQQVEYGEVVNFIDDIKPGDIAFFDNDNKEIIHVGILLNRNSIIHASGKVRIDKFDQFGIFNEDIKDYTHKLRVIKRIR